MTRLNETSTPRRRRPRRNAGSILVYAVETLWIVPLTLMFPYAVLYGFGLLPALFTQRATTALPFVLFCLTAVAGLTALWVSQVLYWVGFGRFPRLRRVTVVGLFAGIVLDLYCFGRLLHDEAPLTSDTMERIYGVILVLLGPLAVALHRLWQMHRED